MKKAFTLIELIIALIIFWSGLLAVLVVLNKNIILAKKVELKTQATLLAKEWMELVYNIRDTNNIKYLPWNYLSWNNEQIKNNTYVKLETWKMYVPLILLTWSEILLKKISVVSRARLFLQAGIFFNSAGEKVYSWFFYNYFTWIKTPFYRYVIFSGVYLQPENEILSGNLLKVISKVWYKYGNLTGKVQMESILTNWR